MMHWTSPLTYFHLPGVYIQLLYSNLPSLPSFVCCLAIWSPLSLLKEGTISNKSRKKYSCNMHILNILDDFWVYIGLHAVCFFMFPFTSLLLFQTHHSHLPCFPSSFFANQLVPVVIATHVHS